jgi:hypothetical protein
MCAFLLASLLCACHVPVPHPLLKNVLVNGDPASVVCFFALTVLVRSTLEGVSRLCFSHTDKEV